MLSGVTWRSHNIPVLCFLNRNQSGNQLKIIRYAQDREERETGAHSLEFIIMMV